MARIKFYWGILLICAILFLFINYKYISRKSSHTFEGSINIRQNSQDKLRVQGDLTAGEENGMVSTWTVQNELDNGDPVPKVVIGILSDSNYTCLRDTQRALFVKAANTYRRLDIKVFFLLDIPSPTLDKEQNIYNDIIYLNTTEHGWDNNFAKKSYNWYKFAVEQYPEALLIGRMDDDVFVCTPQIFDRLNEVMNPLLYYGWGLGKHQLDDMFLFIGTELARRIAESKMCDTERSEHCFENGNAVRRLNKWLSVYSDIVAVNERETGNMVYYTARRSGGMARMKEMYSYYKKDFCKKYILFHKATPMNMYELNKNNELLLNDTSRWKVSEEDIKKIQSCRVNNYSPELNNY